MNMTIVRLFFATLCFVAHSQASFGACNVKYFGKEKRCVDDGNTPTCSICGSADDCTCKDSNSGSGSGGIDCNDPRVYCKGVSNTPPPKPTTTKIDMENDVQSIGPTCTPGRC